MSRTKAIHIKQWADELDAREIIQLGHAATTGVQITKASGQDYRAITTTLHDAKISGGEAFCCNLNSVTRNAVGNGRVGQSKDADEVDAGATRRD